MKRKCLISLILMFALLLTGCSLPSGEAHMMLTPPTLSSGREALTKAIKSAIGEGYELVYPQEGSYRTGIISVDLTGDGVTEAICFYSRVSDGKLGFLVMKSETDGSWSTLAQGISPAASVGRVEFGDLTGDHIAEIIVGWHYLSETDGSYEIYTMKEGKAISCHSGLYTRFVMMGEAPMKLLVLSRNTATKAVTASLIGAVAGSVGVVNTVAMSERSTDFLNLLSAKTSSGQPAVYVDQSLESGQTITEVLVVNDQGRLTNELLNQTNNPTLRYTGVTSLDKENDGIPEIPTEEALPAYLRNGVEENLYLVHWNTYDGKVLTPVSHSFVDTTEKFTLTYPEGWYEKVTVERPADTERAFSFKTVKGEQLFVIRIYGLSEYSDELNAAGWRKLYEDSDHVYTVYCEEENSMNITYNDVYGLFNVI